jgi:hypothetical protein
LVELVKAYSNHADQVEHLRALLGLPKESAPRRPERAAKQAQKRLDRDGVAELEAAPASDASGAVVPQASIGMVGDFWLGDAVAEPPGLVLVLDDEE